MDQITQILFDPTLDKIVTALVALLVISIIVRFLQRTLGDRIKNTDTRYRVRKFISFVGYAVMILVVASIFSDRFGGLSVTLGVAGAGIAFALQEVIASVAGWVALTFSSFYKPGDRVQLGGIKGDVIDIGIIRTTLMEVGEWVSADQYSGRIVRIANSFVFKEPVFNYSGDFPFLWDEIKVPVKYGSDRALAVNIMSSVAQDVVGAYTEDARETWKKLVGKYHIVEASTEPTVTLIATDNWLEYTIRYVVDYGRRRSTKDKLFTQILDRFEQTNGRVMIASTTIDLVSMPTLDVRRMEVAGSKSERPEGPG